MERINIERLKEKAGLKICEIRKNFSNPNNKKMLKTFIIAAAALIVAGGLVILLISRKNVSKNILDEEIKKEWLQNLKLDNKLKEYQVVNVYGKTSKNESEAEDELSDKVTETLSKKKTPRSAGTKKNMIDPTVTEVTSTVTKDDLEKRYKEINIHSVGKNIKVIDLWTDTKHENTYSVRILFAFNKLYYSGNMGTFVFGRSISNIFKFFAGSSINESYWAEKCEASSVPVVCDEIDTEKLKKNLVAELTQLSPDKAEQIQKDADECIQKINDDMERITDEIREYLKKYEAYDVNAAADSIVRQSEDFNKNYLYACELIQWVSNNLKDWEEAQDDAKEA